MYRTRNAAYLQGYRGFKSHPLRHLSITLQYNCSSPLHSEDRHVFNPCKAIIGRHSAASGRSLDGTEAPDPARRRSRNKRIVQGGEDEDRFRDLEICDCAGFSFPDGCGGDSQCGACGGSCQKQSLSRHMARDRQAADVADGWLRGRPIDPVRAPTRSWWKTVAGKAPPLVN